MRKPLLLCVLTYSVLLHPGVAFTSQGYTKTRRRHTFVTEYQPFAIENEKLTLQALKQDINTDTRRKWAEKLASGAGALATAFVHTIAPALASKVEAPAPSSTLLDPTVLTLTKGSKTIHIVGTAHISSVSADLAGRLVRETCPDAVFVELDEARLSRAFKGGIPPPGIPVAIQDDAGRLKVGVTRKPGFAARLMLKLMNSMSNPGMYRKLESAGIPVGAEVSLRA